MSNISYLHDHLPKETAQLAVRERAILDALSEGILVLSGGESDRFGEIAFYISYANKRAGVLLDHEPDDLDDLVFENLLPRGRHARLHDAISSVYATGESERHTISLSRGKAASSRVIADIVADTREDGERRIIITLQPAREVSAWMDGPDVLDSSREELQREVLRLRRELDTIKRVAAHNTDTGLANRAFFLERGAAEFQRSRRYDHHLALAIVRLDGAERRPDAVDVRNLASLAQVCESVSRHGIDVVGRTGQRELAILMPETNTSGALRLADRLQSAIEKTTLEPGDNGRDTHIRIAADALEKDDLSFGQLFDRTRISAK
ncbi:MAG: diguanylate cyclase [Ahrensia sp.]|nr:diguanylate cyclase [Ahrensia sp.]